MVNASPSKPPTNASLPIMGPITQPMPALSPAPVLSPAQRAAQTRITNRNAGIGPAPQSGKVPAKIASARPLGLDLVLSIVPDGQDGIALAFAFRSGDGPADPTSVPADEIAYPLIRAVSWANSVGELEPASQVRMTAQDATADQLAAALPVMRRLNGLILNAYNESEDHSFPQLTLTLATALRVDRIEVHQPDGTITTAKRGAAYISAFKAWEACKRT